MSIYRTLKGVMDGSPDGGNGKGKSRVVDGVLYVDSPKHERYEAYRDSLALNRLSPYRDSDFKYGERSFEGDTNGAKIEYKNDYLYYSNLKPFIKSPMLSNFALMREPEYEHVVLNYGKNIISPVGIYAIDGSRRVVDEEEKKAKNEPYFYWGTRYNPSEVTNTNEKNGYLATYLMPLFYHPEIEPVGERLMANTDFAYKYQGTFKKPRQRVIVDSYKANYGMSREDYEKMLGVQASRNSSIAANKKIEPISPIVKEEVDEAVAKYGITKEQLEENYKRMQENKEKNHILYSKAKDDIDGIWDFIGNKIPHSDAEYFVDKGTGKEYVMSKKDYNLFEQSGLDIGSWFESINVNRPNAHGRKPSPSYNPKQILER